MLKQALQHAVNHYVERADTTQEYFAAKAQVVSEKGKHRLLVTVAPVSQTGELDKGFADQEYEKLNVAMGALRRDLGDDFKEARRASEWVEKLNGFFAKNEMPPVVPVAMPTKEGASCHR